MDYINWMNPNKNHTEINNKVSTPDSPFNVRLEKCVVALRNSWRVAEGVVHRGGWDNADRGDGGGGDSAADPGDTEPDEQGVEPPQYLEDR